MHFSDAHLISFKRIYTYFYPKTLETHFYIKQKVKKLTKVVEFNNCLGNIDFVPRTLITIKNPSIRTVLAISAMLGSLETCAI